MWSGHIPSAPISGADGICSGPGLFFLLPVCAPPGKTAQTPQKQAITWEMGKSAEELETQTMGSHCFVLTQVA